MHHLVNHYFPLCGPFQTSKLIIQWLNGVNHPCILWLNHQYRCLNHLIIPQIHPNTKVWHLSFKSSPLKSRWFQISIALCFREIAEFRLAKKSRTSQRSGGSRKRDKGRITTCDSTNSWIGGMVTNQQYPTTVSTMKHGVEHDLIVDIWGFCRYDRYDQSMEWFCSRQPCFFTHKSMLSYSISLGPILDTTKNQRKLPASIWDYLMYSWVVTSNHTDLISGYAWATFLSLWCSNLAMKNPHVHEFQCSFTLW